MNLSSLKPAEGSVKKRKRIGRGQGSGRGGTSTRGHKGAKSRSGYKNKIGFEGGQMPLQRTSPKFGFNNKFRVEYKGINVSTLQSLAENNGLDTIDIETLVSNGLVARKDLVKILGNGELTAKLSVKAHAFSKTAVEKIQAVGGNIEKIK
ncbi:MAG: 50S ribosomal protein L15 [Bacteroidales bacterium]|jgi:large subunit ribosomal protein L15